MSGRYPCLARIDPVPESLLNNLDEQIGSGSYSVVHSIKSDDNIAVKEYSLDSMAQDVAELLVAVLETSVLLDHPNILNCRRMMRNGDCLYVEMDRYEKSLDSLMRAYKRKSEQVPLRLIRRIARCVCSALYHFHNVHPTGDDVSHLAHGGIKPTNILLDDTKRRVVITDAGMWRCRRAAGSRSMSAHSSSYVAPEVAERGYPTPESDMWSLGVILYELCTIGKPNTLLDAQSIDLSTIDDGVLRGLIGRLLIRDEDKRISSSEMLSLLGSSEADVAMSAALEVMFLRDELKLLVKDLKPDFASNYPKDRPTCFSFPAALSRDDDYVYNEPDFAIPADTIDLERSRGEVEEVKAKLDELTVKYEAAIETIEELRTSLAKIDTRVPHENLSEEQNKNAELRQELNALRAQEAEYRNRVLDLQSQLNEKDSRINDLENRIQSHEKEKAARPNPIPANYLNGTVQQQGYPSGNIPRYVTEARSYPPPPPGLKKDDKN